MNAEVKEIRNTEDQIKKDLDENKIDETEIKSTNTVADFLEKKGKIENLKKDVDKITNKYKDQIRDAIINYFDPKVVDDGKNRDNKELKVDLSSKKLSVEQIDAYINTINRIGEIKDQNIAINMTEIVKTLKDTKNKLTEDKDKEVAQVKEKLGTETLENLLKTTPTKEQANKLFGGENEFRVARDTLFNFPEEKLQILTQEYKYKSIIPFIAKYAGVTQEEIKEITLNKGGEYKEPYIKIKTEVAGKVSFKDILFTKTTDENYKKRADTFSINDWKETTFGKDQIDKLDTQGSYRSFKKLLDGGKYNLKTLMGDINFFPNIKTTNQNKEDNTTKENGYYNIITDHVVDYTKKNPQDLSMLQAYLEQVTPENVKYMGIDQTKQVANFNKLADVVDGPNFPRNTQEGEKIISKMKALKAQLGQEIITDRKQATEKTVDAMWEKYGSVIVEILNFLGGKGFAKKLLGKYYDKYKDQIDKKYEEKYSLSKEEKAQVKEITNGMDSSTILKNLNQGSTGEDFQEAFQKASNDTKYSENLIKEDSYKLIDPTIVYKTIESHNKADTEKKDQIDRREYLIRNEKGKYTLNTKTDNKTKIVNMIMEDRTTRNSIAKANRDIMGVMPGGKDVKAEDISRFDLGSKERQLYSINTTKDIGIALTSYMFAGSKDLDYVITETKLDASVRQEKRDLINQEKTNTETTNTQTPKKIEDYIDSKYLNTDGTLKDVKAISIDKLFINYDNAPDNLLITPKGKTEAIKIKKGTFNGTKTYVYESGGARAIILDGYKISLPTQEKTEVTPEQKAHKQLDNLTTEIEETLKKIPKDKIDFTSFEYKIDAKDELKNYQDNVLQKLTDLLTGATTVDGNSFNNRDLFISGMKNRQDIQFESLGMITLKNMLKLINGKTPGTIPDEVTANRPAPGTKITVEDKSLKISDTEGKIITLSVVGGKFTAKREAKS